MHACDVVRGLPIIIPAIVAVVMVVQPPSEMVLVMTSKSPDLDVMAGIVHHDCVSITVVL